MAWGRSGGARAPRGAAGAARAGRGRRLAWLGGIVAAVLAAALLFLRAPSPGRAASPKPPPAPAPARPVGRAVSPKPPSPAARPRPAPAPSAPRSAPAATNAAPAFAKAPGRLLLPDGRVLTFPPPKEGETRDVHSHGRVYRCDHLGNWEDVTPRPVFGNAFEEGLAGMASESGAFIPGMLLGHDPAEVRALLERRAEVLPDDPEDVARTKEAVAALKADILGFIDRGGTFDEYVEGMRAATARERGARATALRDVSRLLGEGRAREAALYRRAFDEQLAREDLPPVRLPAHFAAALDAAEAAGEERR